MLASPLRSTTSPLRSIDSYASLALWPMALMCEPLHDLQLLNCHIFAEGDVCLKLSLSKTLLSNLQRGKEKKKPT